MIVGMLPEPWFTERSSWYALSCAEGEAFGSHGAMSLRALPGAGLATVRGETSESLRSSLARTIVSFGVP